MQKILFFLQVFVFQLDSLNINRRETEARKPPDITLELVEEDTYKLKVNVGGTVNIFTLVKENKNVEVLVAEDNDVIKKVDPEVSKN